ncbi:MAG TPA: competence/damage-inducible protein A [Pyrinomonadaceae bacterium]|nr:competence/damage-inducible protein A [Pyrinomonadaceae bacterium]
MKANRPESLDPALFETLSAEIIAIGSELLAPDRSDTNSLWLTEQLNGLGIEVKLKTIVGDDDARLEEAIKDALRRTKVVITTGGLGPTEDDITRKVTARALGKRLLLDEEVLQEIRKRFESFGRTMPERNSRQAMVIEDSVVLPNPNGTAPGLFLEHHGAAIVLLPGPPREMQPMFENHVRPRLAGRAGQMRVLRRVIKVAGMGESAVDEKIAPVYTQYTNPQTTILFNRSEIDIQLTASGRTDSDAEQLLDKVTEQLEDALGHSIFSFRGETMEEVVAARLTLGGYTIGVAESCTGGLLAQRLTSIAGSSRYFIEGVVAYSNDAKTRTLGVEPILLLEHGAVSAPVAEAMAEGIRRRAGTDFGLSITGIAGPGGGSDEKPVGLVYIALVDDVDSKTRKLMLPGDRDLIRWRASQAALDLLRRRLL